MAVNIHEKPLMGNKQITPWELPADVLEKSLTVQQTRHDANQNAFISVLNDIQQYKTRPEAKADIDYVTNLYSEYKNKIQGQLDRFGGDYGRLTPDMMLRATDEVLMPRKHEILGIAQNYHFWELEQKIEQEARVKNQEPLFISQELRSAPTIVDGKVNIYASTVEPKADWANIKEKYFEPIGNELRQMVGNNYESVMDGNYYRLETILRADNWNRLQSVLNGAINSYIIENTQEFRHLTAQHVASGMEKAEAEDKAREDIRQSFIWRAEKRRLFSEQEKVDHFQTPQQAANSSGRGKGPKDESSYSTSNSVTSYSVDGISPFDGSTDLTTKVADFNSPFDVTTVFKEPNFWNAPDVAEFNNIEAGVWRGLLVGGPNKTYEIKEPIIGPDGEPIEGEFKTVRQSKDTRGVIQKIGDSGSYIIGGKKVNPTLTLIDDDEFDEYIKYLEETILDRNLTEAEKINLSASHRDATTNKLYISVFETKYDLNKNEYVTEISPFAEAKLSDEHKTVLAKFKGDKAIEIAGYNIGMNNIRLKAENLAHIDKDLRLKHGIPLDVQEDFIEQETGRNNITDVKWERLNNVLGSSSGGTMINSTSNFLKEISVNKISADMFISPILGTIKLDILEAINDDIENNGNTAFDYDNTPLFNSYDKPDRFIINYQYQGEGDKNNPAKQAKNHVSFIMNWANQQGITKDELVVEGVLQQKIHDQNSPKHIAQMYYNTPEGTARSSSQFNVYVKEKDQVVEYSLSDNYKDFFGKLPSNIDYKFDPKNIPEKSRNVDGRFSDAAFEDVWGDKRKFLQKLTPWSREFITKLNVPLETKDQQIWALNAFRNWIRENRSEDPPNTPNYSTMTPDEQEKRKQLILATHPSYRNYMVDVKQLGDPYSIQGHVYNFVNDRDKNLDFNSRVLSAIKSANTDEVSAVQYDVSEENGGKKKVSKSFNFNGRLQEALKDAQKINDKATVDDVIELIGIRYDVQDGLVTDFTLNEANGKRTRLEYKGMNFSADDLNAIGMFPGGSYDTLEVLKKMQESIRKSNNTSGSIGDGPMKLPFFVSMTDDNSGATQYKKGHYYTYDFNANSNSPENKIVRFQNVNELYDYWMQNNVSYYGPLIELMRTRDMIMRNPEMGSNAYPKLWNHFKGDVDAILNSLDQSINELKNNKTISAEVNHSRQQISYTPEQQTLINSNRVGLGGKNANPLNIKDHTAAKKTNGAYDPTTTKLPYTNSDLKITQLGIDDEGHAIFQSMDQGMIFGIDFLYTKWSQDTHLGMNNVYGKLPASAYNDEGMLKVGAFREKYAEYGNVQTMLSRMKNDNVKDKKGSEITYTTPINEIDFDQLVYYFAVLEDSNLISSLGGKTYVENMIQKYLFLNKEH